MTAWEVNFDGLVGPTHNYAGLSFGNVASFKHANAVARPKEAALQGLAKMKALADMGFMQGVLPPHERPHVESLRRLGFAGSDTAVLTKAWQTNPNLVLASSSASPMWTANAATVSPSSDTDDGRVHFTPANLAAMYHRALEHPVTGRALQAIFRDSDYFAHHQALPSLLQLGDEGAANHTRFCRSYGEPGVEFFVFGRYAFENGRSAPQNFPARQTFEASSAIARAHGLNPDHCVFAQQNPELIDAGVFHNDVIAVGNAHVLFHYQDAFVETDKVLAELRAKVPGFVSVEVRRDEVPLSDVISSYLFNSQLLNWPDGKGMMLILPKDAEETPSVKAWLDRCLAEKGPIREVRYFDLRQSMRNGGGPACLRLRVVLTDAELAATNPRALMTDQLYGDLCHWVESHYRDELSAQDLGDPALLGECRAALEELSEIMDLGPIYDFQRT